jgi:hypothetical protein
MSETKYHTHIEPTTVITNSNNNVVIVDFSLLLVVFDINTGS